MLKKNSRYVIALNLVCILLSLVAGNAFANAAAMTFFKEQAAGVSSGKQMVEYSFQDSIEMVEKIQKTRESTNDRAFLLYYTQNILHNPLNDVYLMWETDSPFFTIPQQKKDISSVMPSAIIGKQIYSNLSKNEQEGMLINGEHFTFSGVAGEKSVYSGFFDEALILNAASMDSAFISRMPQNISGYLYIQAEGEISLEELEKILEVNVEERIRGTSLFMEELEYTGNLDVKLPAIVATEMSFLYFSIGLSLIICIDFLQLRQRNYIHVLKLLGASNRKLILGFVRNGVAGAIISSVCLVVLYAIGWFFDWRMLLKVPSSGLYFIFFQIIVLQLCYVGCMTKIILRTNIAQTLKEGK
ncbi:hypothetical protein AwErysi_06560 [Erysipelotrichaceae bacterium]|nr:hypothetical protein AwErysi_06560 [Erysipelotrichaceae bacterium]